MHSRAGVRLRIIHGEDNVNVEEISMKVAEMSEQVDDLERTYLREIHRLQRQTGMVILIMGVLIAVAFLMGVYL